MDFVQNIPFFSIVLSMFTAILTSMLNGKWAKRVCISLLVLVMLLSASLLFYLMETGDSFTYLMGHYPAPWGNELRAGMLEAGMALFFCIIVLLSILGGIQYIFEDVEESKVPMYFVLVNLILSSLLALVYTNDLFTAYVFIEINTIAGCGLIMIRQLGKTAITATRYMVVSLIGSGFFLIGVTLLYTLTGHLLMSNLKESVELIVKEEQYLMPLIVTIGLITVGLAIKSGLFPFHLWIPDAYGYSNVSSSALLSGVVSKGYIFLLIKIYYRILGTSVVISSHITDILFVFGVAGIIMGSMAAIRETSLRKIIAYSSVAQIGYIYLGIGLGTDAGMIAAIFHMMSHGSTKALLFISSARFTEGSHTKVLYEIQGLGMKYRFSGFAFMIGSFSMIGLPLLSGFVSKLLFSTASLQNQNKMLIALFVLAVSTILNAIYFLRIVIKLYTPYHTTDKNNILGLQPDRERKKAAYVLAMLLFVMLNFVLGIFSQPIIELLEHGISLFAAEGGWRLLC